MGAALNYDPAIWRIQPLGDQRYAFGPLVLTLGLEAADARYFDYMCQTPRRGAYFTDLEALEFLPVATPTSVAGLNKRVRDVHKKAVHQRFGQNIDCGLPLLTQVTTHYWRDQPVSIINSASSIITVFMLALNAGLKADERARLSRLTGRRWLARDLRGLPKFVADDRSSGLTCITYAGARRSHTSWQVWLDFIEKSGGEATVWPALRSTRKGQPDFDASLNILHYPWRRQGAKHHV